MVGLSAQNKNPSRACRPCSSLQHGCHPCSAPRHRPFMHARPSPVIHIHHICPWHVYAQNILLPLHASHTTRSEAQSSCTKERAHAQVRPLSPLLDVPHCCMFVPHPLASGLRVLSLHCSYPTSSVEHNGDKTHARHACVCSIAHRMVQKYLYACGTH